MHKVRRNFCLGLALVLLSLCGCSQSGVPAATSDTLDIEIAVPISTQAATSVLRAQDVPESVCREIIDLYEKNKENSIVRVVVPVIDHPTAAILDTRAIQVIDIPIEMYNNTLASDGTPALLTYTDYTSLVQSGEPLVAKHYLIADRPIYKEDLVFEKDMKSGNNLGSIVASPAHPDTIDIVVIGDCDYSNMTRDSVVVKPITYSAYISFRDDLGLECIRADEWNALWDAMNEPDCPYTSVTPLYAIVEGSPVYKSNLYICDAQWRPYIMQRDGTVAPK